MNGNDLIKIPGASTGLTLNIPAWCVLEGIFMLSDNDKADFATAIVEHIADNPTSNALALSVLRQRCRTCGRKISFDEICDCNK